MVRLLFKRFSFLRFFLASLIALTVDSLIYFSLFGQLAPFWVQVLAASGGFVTNFILQKMFVFNLKRKASHAFFMSACFSMMGVLISGIFIQALSDWVLTSTWTIVNKYMVVAVMFIYNFFTKRWIFEGRQKIDGTFSKRVGSTITEQHKEA